MTDEDQSAASSSRQPTNSEKKFTVVRRVYQQDSLNIEADYHTPNLSRSQHIKKFVRKCGFGDCLRHSVPIIDWLPKYKIKEYLLGDFIAGIIIAVIHVPHGMAFSFLAYCPPTVGLYMAFFPIFIFAIFSNSPHVCVGTFAITMLMAGKVVLRHANVPDESTGIYTPEEVLSALSFTVGMILLIMWCLRLGAMYSVMSEPLVSGLMTGASFQVCASQLKDLFGIEFHKIPANFKIIYTLIEVFNRFPQTNWAALTISIMTCLFLAANYPFTKMQFCKHSLWLPSELIVVVAGTLAARVIDLETKNDITVVGFIGTGFPKPTPPPFKLIKDLLIDAFALAMVTYTITMTMGLIFATKDKYEIDANQELLAMGASNIFGCFFVCGPLCASFSRSYLKYSAGCKTLIASLISASLIFVVLLWVGPFFETLPRSVLASVVVVSLKGLYKRVCDFVKYWNLSKLDAIVWLVTFLVTLIVNIDYGLVAGVLANIGTLFFRSQTPYSCLLGRVLDTNLYLDINRYRAAHELPGIKIFHYCGGLNFASKNLFRDKLFRKTGFLRLIDVDEVTKHTDSNLTLATSYVWNRDFSRNIHCVIIDAAALSYVDAPGIKILVDVTQALTSSNITTLLAGPNGPVLEMINKFNSLEEERLQLLTFPTVHDAVMYYNSTTTKIPRKMDLNTDDDAKKINATKGKD